jgi:TetR/AcrR family fatty acid metabolism transcriptional regulator
MSASQPTRTRNGPDKRQLILDAAIKIFARTGYHGARVSDIAREAGIAYGLVYHYFKNKEQILDTIFEEQWSGFLATLETIAAGTGQTEDKLNAIARLILEAYRVRSDWVKVLVFEIQRSPRFSNPDQILAMSRMFRIVAGILRAGQEAGELREEIDPEVACFVFIGALDIFVTSRVLDVIRLDEGGNQAAEYFPKAARTVVDLFVNGCGTRAEPHRTR